MVEGARELMVYNVSGTGSSIRGAISVVSSKESAAEPLTSPLVAGSVAFELQPRSTKQQATARRAVRRHRRIVIFAKGVSTLIRYPKVPVVSALERVGSS